MYRTAGTEGENHNPFPYSTHFLIVMGITAWLTVSFLALLVILLLPSPLCRRYYLSPGLAVKFRAVKQRKFWD